MVWVIERWFKATADCAGCWLFARHPDGQPMWYSRKCEAQIALRSLPKGRYRITSMRD